MTLLLCRKAWGKWLVMKGLRDQNLAKDCWDGGDKLKGNRTSGRTVNRVSWQREGEMSRGEGLMSQHLQLLEPPQGFKSIAPHEHSVNPFRFPHLLLSVRAALSSSTHTQREPCSQQSHVTSHKYRNAEVGMCLCSPPTPTGVKWTGCSASSDRFWVSPRMETHSLFPSSNTQSNAK